VVTDAAAAGPLRRRVRRVALVGAALGTLLAAAVPAVAGAAPTVAGYDPATDVGSLSMITRVVGAQTMWDAGYTGRGIDVAVIDTGVTRVPGLDNPGKVIDGPDLSFDSGDPAFENLDTFGHGTHMASIIAGSDVAPGTPGGSACTTCTGNSAYSDATKFVGVAPESRIVNVKVGATDGAADVSQVIAAIDWVVQHRNDPGLNIKVLNLSFGTDSTQAWGSDPLSFAVENAWNKGIVVVVAGGNDALQPVRTPLAMPAVNPHILAVGAVDTKGTLATSDDEVPTFSQHGSYNRSLDVTAPGLSVLGLRVPGSYVDTAVGTGQVGERFQRGSGTSQATAVVSGLAALLVQRYPLASPDQIKAFLIQKGNALDPSLPGNAALGAGKVEANVATAALTATKLPAPVAYKDRPATGTGSLDASRGSVRVASDGVVLSGERDIFGRPWVASQWASRTKQGTAWTGGTWNGSRWTGDSWSGSRWTGSRWTGNDWAGSRWTGSRWTGMAWDGSRWTGSGWGGSRWTGSRWTGGDWSSARWS
jgi:serine protease AprX